MFKLSDDDTRALAAARYHTITYVMFVFALAFFINELATYGYEDVKNENK